MGQAERASWDFLQSQEQCQRLQKASPLFLFTSPRHREQLPRTCLAGAFLPPEPAPVPKVWPLGSRSLCLAAFASTVNEIWTPRELVAAVLLLTQADGNNQLQRKG